MKSINLTTSEEGRGRSVKDINRRSKLPFKYIPFALGGVGGPIKSRCHEGDFLDAIVHYSVQK